MTTNGTNYICTNPLCIETCHREERQAKWDRKRKENEK